MINNWAQLIIEKLESNFVLQLLRLIAAAQTDIWDISM